MPLSAVVTLSEGNAPVQIGHLGQFPSTSISFNLAKGASLGSAVDEISQAEADIGLPASFNTAYQGALSAFQKSLSNELVLIVAAVVAVYIVLGVLYESFLHPITILSTLPSAGVGALARVAPGRRRPRHHRHHRHHPPDRHREEECDHDDRFRARGAAGRGQEPARAIHQACLLRFRPILMTTMAALLGALPLMLGPGTGSELRRPLGICIVGGLLVSQLLTLFTTPVVYLAIDGSAQRFFRPSPMRRSRPGRRRAAGMNISAPFISRPVATTLLTIAIALAGVLGYSSFLFRHCRRSIFPRSWCRRSCRARARTSWRPASRSRSSDTSRQIADVTEMTSQSQTGQARIILQFGLDRDINGAAQDVQAAINAAQADLPTNLLSQPTYRKVNPADAPVLILSLTSPTLTRGQMYDAASNVLMQQLSQLSGVGQVIIGGAALPAVRVELDPTKLSHYGIGLEDIRSALSSANANARKATSISADVVGRFIPTIRPITPRTIRSSSSPIAMATRCCLENVADVEDSVQDLRNLGLADGKPAVLVIVFRQPGANIITTVNSVRAAIPQLKAAMPADIDIALRSDRSTTIRASLARRSERSSSPCCWSSPSSTCSCATAAPRSFPP